MYSLLGTGCFTAKKSVYDYDYNIIKSTVYPKRKSTATTNHIRESLLSPEKSKVALFKKIYRKEKEKEIVKYKLEHKTFDE